MKDELGWLVAGISAAGWFLCLLMGLGMGRDGALRSCLAHPALVQHCAALDASDDAKLQALKDALDAAKAEKE